MSRPRWEANLRALCASFAPSPDAPGAVAARLFLAHSTSDAKFAAICGSGALVSLARQFETRGIALPADRTEVQLGTADSVFFYAAPFRYPSTGCGLLFRASLESDHRDDGSATPFDSGALLRVCTRDDPSESPRDFLARHELPLPEHRNYLQFCMQHLFASPEDYINGVDPIRDGPVRLSGGDQRRWTHEVRIPREVALRTSHLQAVFAPRARIAADPAIEALFTWAAGSGVDSIVIDTPRANDFEALRREAIAYIRRTLY